MELDDLKASWEEVGEKIEKQLKLNAKLIEKMTQQNYRIRLNKIAYPEIFGSLVCLGMAGRLVLVFDRFNTPGLRLFAALSVLLLILLPVVSLQSLRGLTGIDIGRSAYAEVLDRFTAMKVRFVRLHRLNAVLASLLVVSFLPTAVRLFAVKDITGSASFWLVQLPLSLVFQV
ncbi:MAG: hypothetical protein JST42_11965, partial [Bacteroidetes bacterium]|nr:hypothetical protein [Bacteroidota bacterium]